MPDDLPEQKQPHAERVRGKHNRSLKTLPSNSQENWPANLGELLKWYADEVEDVTRAAQLRLRNASKVIDDYRTGKTDFSEAAKAVEAHGERWRQIFPGQIEDSIRGKSDEEINNAIDAFRVNRESKSRGRG